MILENIATISEKYRPLIGHLISLQTSDWLIYAALIHDHVKLILHKELKCKAHLIFSDRLLPLQHIMRQDIFLPIIFHTKKILYTYTSILPTTRPLTFINIIIAARNMNWSWQHKDAKIPWIEHKAHGIKVYHHHKILKSCWLTFGLTS